MCAQRRGVASEISTRSSTGTCDVHERTTVEDLRTSSVEAVKRPRFRQERAAAGSSPYKSLPWGRSDRALPLTNSEHKAASPPFIRFLAMQLSETVPSSLLPMQNRKVHYLAFSGNPFNTNLIIQSSSDLPVVRFSFFDLALHEDAKTWASSHVWTVSPSPPPATCRPWGHHDPPGPTSTRTRAALTTASSSLRYHPTVLPILPARRHACGEKKPSTP